MEEGKATRIERANNLKLLKAMHEVVMCLNDEDAIEPWLFLVPDEPDEDDFAFIAGDHELMDAVCRSFRHRIAQGGKAGWLPTCIPGNSEVGQLYGSDW